MKIYYECFPCFINQALRFLRNENDEDSLKNENILREVMHSLGDMDFSLTPPEMTRRVFDIVEKYYGKRDIYEKEKRNSNKYILGMYDELKNIIEKSDDSFDTAMRLAITGNIIDFGANHKFMDEQIHQEIDNALKEENFDPVPLKTAISDAEKILYIGDNAGEIVFDKLFLEQLPKDKITFSVRGGHILNDVLMEDAETVGITEIVNVISSGADMPGTVLERCSDEFVDMFNKADLIIAKGQGNYETLSDVKDKNIFFLLKIKCPVVARDTGAKVGALFADKK